MRTFISGVFLFFCSIIFAHSQNQEHYTNDTFLKNLYSDSSYLNLKNKVAQKYNHAKPGRWGEFVNGVCEDLKTSQKVVALTFDACGGEKGTGFDKELIDYLRKEKIPATMFNKRMTIGALTKTGAKSVFNNEKIPNATHANPIA